MKSFASCVLDRTANSGVVEAERVGAMPRDGVLDRLVHAHRGRHSLRAYPCRRQAPALQQGAWHGGALRGARCRGVACRCACRGNRPRTRIPAERNGRSDRRDARCGVPGLPRSSPTSERTTTPQPASRSISSRYARSMTSRAVRSFHCVGMACANAHPTGRRWRGTLRSRLSSRQAPRSSRETIPASCSMAMPCASGPSRRSRSHGRRAAVRRFCMLERRLPILAHSTRPRHPLCCWGDVRYL